MPENPLNLETRVIGLGVGEDPAHRAVMPPIYLSSTYCFEGFDGRGAYDYSRTANPTRTTLARTLTELEGGANAIVTATGMAALDLVFHQVAKDGWILAPHDCYGGTYRLLNARRERGQLNAEFIDQSDGRALTRALARKPSLVLLESPSNPLMRIVDIAAITAAAHGVGAKVAVDNTFLSPALQQPLKLGADYAVHSTTKLINGHSDVVGGAVVCRLAEDFEPLRWWANCAGITGAAFDSYLTLRGVRTLFIRAQRAQDTAQKIVAALNGHPKIAKLHYPGLADHPGYAIAQAQQAGPGSMLSLEVAGDLDAVRRFFKPLSLFTIAQSLGGVESLIAHPASMTHAGMAPEARATAGITDSLVRLSVGLEHAEDLIQDLKTALDAV